MSTLKPLNRQTANVEATHPERIVQFGAGNFVRAFVDWIMQQLNEQTDFASSIVVVKVTPHGTYDALDQQDGLFHIHLQGIQKGSPVSQTKLITCISRTVYPYHDYDAYRSLARQPEIRFLISNTTEAGISYNESDSANDAPPTSFPAKLTAFLHERYQHFAGADDKGCIIMPTELVEDNGAQLRDMILRYAQQWELDAGFSIWIREHNIFCNTLVDRIVPGFPHAQSEQIFNELGYEDKLLVMGESYHSWIIEAPVSLQDEFPVDQTDLHVRIVADAHPYRQTKVRILNGAHTAMVAVGYILGLETVRECVEHPVMGTFLRDLVYKEIIPSMDLPEDELKQFADDVFDRFRNPHIHHRLLSIATNSSTKMRTRLLPTLKCYHKKYNALPERVVIAFAAFIRFYKGEWQGETIPLSDDPAVIDRFRQRWQSLDIDGLVTAVLQDEALWHEDLSQIVGLHERLCHYLKAIDENGMLPVLESTGSPA